MSGPQGCWEKLRELAQAGSADPRQAAAKIVRQFADNAEAGELAMLRHRLADTLEAGRYTAVPVAYLDQHGRWLTVLESACAAVEKGRSGSIPPTV